MSGVERSRIAITLAGTANGQVKEVGPAAARDERQDPLSATHRW